MIETKQDIENWLDNYNKIKDTLDEDFKLWGDFCKYTLTKKKIRKDYKGV